MIEYRNEAMEQEFLPGNESKELQLSHPSVYLILATLFIMACSFLAWGIFGTVTDKAQMKAVVFPRQGTQGVSIPNSGTVRQMMVHKGDHVKAGQTLALVDIGNKYSILTSNTDGTVLSCLQESETFQAFTPVVDLLTDSQKDQEASVIAFTDFKTVRELTEDMEVQVNPTFRSRETNGYIRSHITHISTYPISEAEAAQRLRLPQFVQDAFPQGGAAFEVDIELEHSKENPGEYDWTFVQERPVEMTTGTFCNVLVVTRRRSIFKYLFENVRESYRRVHEVVLE